MKPPGLWISSCESLLSSTVLSDMNSCFKIFTLASWTLQMQGPEVSWETTQRQCHHYLPQWGMVTTAEDCPQCGQPVTSTVPSWSYPLGWFQRSTWVIFQWSALMVLLYSFLLVHNSYLKYSFLNEDLEIINEWMVLPTAYYYSMVLTC